MARAPRSGVRRPHVIRLAPYTCLLSAMSSTSPQLFLLMGPSGVGKSTIADSLARSFGFLCIEFDQWQIDGVDATGLRSQWNALYCDKRPAPLAKELARRAVAQRLNGVVVSLPALVVLPVELIEDALAVGISTVVLYGADTECLNSFLRREQESGRNLDATHWNSNNRQWYSDDGFVQHAPYTVLAFAGGAHRAIGDLVSEVVGHAVA